MLQRSLGMTSSFITASFTGSCCTLPTVVVTACNFLLPLLASSGGSSSLPSAPAPPPPPPLKTCTRLALIRFICSFCWPGGTLRVPLARSRAPGTNLPASAGSSKSTSTGSGLPSSCSMVSLRVQRVTAVAGRLAGREWG